MLASAPAGALPRRDRLAVAMVIEKYPPFVGGAERQAEMLASLVSRRVGRCHVFTGQRGAESAAAVDLHRLGTARRAAPRHALNYLAAFSYFLARGQRYSVVHGHALSGLVCGAVLGARARGRASVVKICSVGGEGDIAKLRRSSFGRGLWPLLRRVGTFSVPTPTLVADLLSAGVPAPRIAVIPNAVAPVPGGAPSRAAARASLGLPERPTVLFVGRLVPGKGLDVLLRAWDGVAGGTEATLAIVGGGPGARGLAEWACASRHAGSIRLFGERTDVDPFYRAADVLVAPSRGETFGNVVAEAMVRGLAVVTTPVGLAAHWGRHEDNAILIRGDEPDELAAGLGRLLRDQPLRARLGAAARREALLSFAPDVVVDQWVDLYGRLASGRAAAPP